MRSTIVTITLATCGLILVDSPVFAQQQLQRTARQRSVAVNNATRTKFDQWYEKLPTSQKSNFDRMVIHLRRCVDQRNGEQQALQNIYKRFPEYRKIVATMPSASAGREVEISLSITIKVGKK